MTIARLEWQQSQTEKHNVVLLNGIVASPECCHKLYVQYEQIPGVSPETVAELSCTRTQTFEPLVRLGAQSESSSLTQDVNILGLATRHTGWGCQGERWGPGLAYPQVTPRQPPGEGTLGWAHRIGGPWGGLHDGEVGSCDILGDMLTDKLKMSQRGSQPGYLVQSTIYHKSSNQLIL